MNSKYGQLLPHPPALRQKPSSLKQRPCWLLSWTGRPPADGLAHGVTGRIRTCHTTILSQLTALNFFNLTNPKLGEENTSETLKTQPSRREWIFSLRSPVSLCRPPPLPVCLLCTCVSSPSINSSSTADSVWCCLRWLRLLRCHLWHSRIFLPFNSLTSRANEIKTP